MPQTKTKPTTTSPTVSPSLAPDPLVDPLEAPVIPEAPVLTKSKPTLTQQAHDLLDRSESQGGHGRKEHDGNSHAYMDGRGKKVATSFMSTYDQDKSFGTFMNAGGGGVYNNTKKQPQRKIKNGKNKGKMIPSNDVHSGDAGQGKYRTAPLARVSEKQSDGSYEHYNAKVKGGFAKFIHESGSTRAQTFFPNDYEKLERPLPGGQVPTSKVKGDSIEDVQSKLRPTNTVEKSGLGPVGKVVDKPPEVEEPVEEAPVQEAPVEQEAVAPKKGPVPAKPNREKAGWPSMSKNQKKAFRRKEKRWEQRYNQG